MYRRNSITFQPVIIQGCQAFGYFFLWVFKERHVATSYPNQCLCYSYDSLISIEVFLECLLRKECVYQAVRGQSFSSFKVFNQCSNFLSPNSDPLSEALSRFVVRGVVFLQEFLYFFSYFVFFCQYLSLCLSIEFP